MTLAPQDEHGAIAADGYVRIGAQLADAATSYFTLHCARANGCHRCRPLSIPAAFRLLGHAPGRSVQALRGSLVCSVCRNRHVVIDYRTDPRPAELRAGEGQLPETLADLCGAGVALKAAPPLEIAPLQPCQGPARGPQLSEPCG